MHNRAQFWSPVPDWLQVSLVGSSIRVAPVESASVWLVSGTPPALPAGYGIEAITSPRQCGDASRYALRLAPDRLLFVSGTAAETSFGWSSEGGAITDVSDGIVIFDILGEAAGELMARGSEYPFLATAGPAEESASIRFAGFKLAVAKRTQGWRIHIERPWAPALWRWLQVQVEQG
jgi:sarcosine oxidase gamma subunit